MFGKLLAVIAYCFFFSVWKLDCWCSFTVGWWWDEDFQEEDANLEWNPDWTWRNMPVQSDERKIEGNWSFESYQPSYTWTWPSSNKRKRREQPISMLAAFGRVIEYLTVHAPTIGGV